MGLADDGRMRPRQIPHVGLISLRSDARDIPGHCRSGYHTLVTLRDTVYPMTWELFLRYNVAQFIANQVTAEEIRNVAASNMFE